MYNSENKNIMKTKNHVIGIFILSIKKIILSPLSFWLTNPGPLNAYSNSQNKLYCFISSMEVYSCDSEYTVTNTIANIIPHFPAAVIGIAPQTKQQNTTTFCNLFHRILTLLTCLSTMEH